MKRIKNILLVSAATLSLAACQQQMAQPEPPTPFDHTIRVAVNGIGLQDPGDGYTTDNLKDFDLMLYDIIDTRYEYGNTKFTKNDQGEWSPSSEMFWGFQDDRYDLCAFAPSLPKGAINRFSTYNIEIPSDVSSPAKLDSTDYIMWGMHMFSPEIHLKDGKIPIKFKHMMAQVNLSVQTTYGIGDSWVNLSISGLRLKGTMGFEPESWDTIVVDPKADLCKDFKPCLLPIGGTNFARFFVIPQTVDAKQFKMAFNCKTYNPDYKVYYTDSIARTFEAGKVYNIWFQTSWGPTVGKGVNKKSPKVRVKITETTETTL